MALVGTPILPTGKPPFIYFLYSYPSHLCYLLPPYLHNGNLPTCLNYICLPNIGFCIFPKDGCSMLIYSLVCNHRLYLTSISCKKKKMFFLFNSCTYHIVTLILFFHLCIFLMYALHNYFFHK